MPDAIILVSVTGRNISDIGKAVKAYEGVEEVRPGYAMENWDGLFIQASGEMPTLGALYKRLQETDGIEDFRYFILADKRV